MARQAFSRDIKRAMISQFLGVMLHAYDMAIVLVMAPLVVKLCRPRKAPLGKNITIVFTYSITMAARPVGSAFFGHCADKIGRKMLLILTIGGVGVMSLIGGLLST